MRKWARWILAASLVLAAAAAIAREWSDWEPCVNDSQVAKRAKDSPASGGRCWWTWQFRNDHDETVDIHYGFSFRPGERKPFDHTALAIPPGGISEGAEQGPCGPFWIDARGIRRR